MLKKLVVVTFVLSSIGAFASSGSRPDSGKRKRRGRGECRQEVRSFCSEHKGNREAKKACIKENIENFSSKCKAKFQKRLGLSN